MTYKLVVTDSVRYEDEQIYRVHYYNETMRCRMQTKKLELKGEPCGLVQVRSEKVIRNVTVEIEYYPPNNVLTNPEDFTRQWIHSSDHKNITLLLTIGIYEEELVQSDKYVLTILMINKSVNGEYMVYCGNELGYTDLVTVEIKEKPHDKEEYGEKQKSIEQASNKLVIWIVLGLCLLVTCIIIAVVLFVVIRKRRQNRKEKKESRVYNQTNVDIIRNSQHNPEDDLQGNQNVVSHEHDVAAEVPEYSRPLEKKTRENVHNTYLEVIEAGSSAKQHRAVDGKLLYAELDFDRNDTRSKGSVVKRPDSPTEYADIDCVKTKAEKDISNTAKEPENIYANS